jgi:hypothetical protein
VDILLKKNVVQAEKEVQWLDELSDILCYTWDLKASSEVWQEDYPEGGTLATKLIRHERILSTCHTRSCFCRELPSDPLEGAKSVAPIPMYG